MDLPFELIDMLRGVLEDFIDARFCLTTTRIDGAGEVQDRVQRRHEQPVLAVAELAGVPDAVLVRCDPERDLALLLMNLFKL